MEGEWFRLEWRGMSEMVAGFDNEGLPCLIARIYWQKEKRTNTEQGRTRGRLSVRNERRMAYSETPVTTLTVSLVYFLALFGELLTYQLARLFSRSNLLHFPAQRRSSRRFLNCLAVSFSRLTICLGREKNLIIES